MKNIYLNAGTINEVFNELENSFDGVLDANDNEFKLALKTDLIKGNIDGITFINGITSIQVSVTFSDDIRLSMESFSKSSIVFAYCKEGKFGHSFGISGEKSTVRKHHSAIVTSSRSINTVLHFNKNIPLQFSIIKVETAGTSQTVLDPLLSNLKKTFLNKHLNYNYHGIQNLRITKKLNQLNAINEPGMVGHILKKDCIQSILSLEIDDNTEALIKMSRAIKRSSLDQINEIKKIYFFIKLYSFDAIYNKISSSKNSIFIK
jgi:hypothetical protein